MGACLNKLAQMSTNQATNDPFNVYVPVESLTEQTVRSIISVATSFKSPNMDYSERTVLIFLLAINKKLKEIENNANENDKKPDDNLLEHVKKVRQWLVDKNGTELNWDELKEKYNRMAGRNCDQMADFYGSQDAKPYFEIRMKTRYDDVKRSREYMEKFRPDGFQPEELKLYWNAEQLENLIPKPGDSSEKTPPHDPSDQDAIENLRQYPVSERKHSGTIRYVNDGIQKAVFDVPKDAQIIVLNFANEQSPGGGYLRHALAQEEVILYNSDGYRALLDLKYKRMGGGYAIPEFGLAYVRNIRFVDPEFDDRHREADMLVSACYCMSGQELYRNPRSREQWKENNLAKFRAFMSAAVANTKGNGSDTYLLLGPIGTGAFGNDVNAIAEVFRDVLEMSMMNSNGPIRYVFENIWFVSTEAWKNEHFEAIISRDKSADHQEP